MGLVEVESPSQRPMLKLVLYPDPVLKKRAAEIAEIDDRVRERAAEMLELMYEEAGVGLAAPQVGWSVRLFVMNAELEQPSEGERVFVNPRIIERGDDEESDEEGCLSIPDIRGKVCRSSSIVISAQNLDGETIEAELSELPARVFQHEFDHLDGILFIRHLSATEKLFAKKVLRRLEKEYKERERLAAEREAAKRGKRGGSRGGGTRGRGPSRRR
jgi:peptide deformylase